jgi:hypothetical protein
MYENGLVEPFAVADTEPVGWLQFAAVLLVEMLNGPGSVTVKSVSVTHPLKSVTVQR